MIETVQNIKGAIETADNISGYLANNQLVGGNVGVGVVGSADYYTGDYTIIPLAYEEQELQTRNKVLEENMIIKEVPYFEVSNIEGTTIYIASEV